MLPELELREGWATVILLLLMLLCVAWAIQTADWTDGLAILQAVVVVGGIFGIVMAKSRVPNLTAHLLAALAGVTWSVFLTSRVLAGATGLSAEAAVVELDRQLRNWLIVLFSGGTSAGNLMFLLLIAFLFWWMAYVSAWAVFRWHRVWWAVILCGLVLMINVTYAPNNLTGFLLVFLLFALLLVVRTSLASYQEEWRVAKVGYSSDLVYAFFRAGLVVALVAIVLAWVAPQALASRPMQEVWDQVAQPWRRLQDQSSRVFHDLNYRNQPAFITFARSMRFGGAVELSDAPVMDIQSPIGRYWRVMAFHEYTGDGWDNTDVDVISAEPNEQKLAYPDMELRREVTQTITLRQDLGPQGTIAAAGQPLRAALPIQAVVSYLVEEPNEEAAPEATPEPNEEAPPEATSEPPVPGDASVLYSRELLKAEDLYQVVSALSRADEESLAEAGTDYPDWVVPRYLQLPETLPERVTVLAEQITAGRSTPYDKAVAIERYLRDLPYNERIDAPTEGRDGVDYFLFGVKEGYCDYYASAMTVMLRSVGVPARYVRGYSQGRKEEGVYHVLERDGHAWPEVYFPGYGWVEFEPTAGEPVLVRPRPPDSSAQSGADRDRRGAGFGPDESMEDLFAHELEDAWYPETPESFLQRVGRWGGLALAVAGLGLLVVALFMFRRHRRIEGLSASERVYGDLVDGVQRLLKISPLAHQTPNEYGDTVAVMLPDGREPVEHIVDSYVGYRFGARTGDDAQVEDAWRQTRRALWNRWFRQQGERLKAIPRKLFPTQAPEPEEYYSDIPKA